MPDAHTSPVRDARCAAHPSRPAADSCPVCARPRCGADAASAPGGGCLVCGGVTQEPVRTRPPGDLERTVRAALAAYAAAVAWGYVTSEYVGADVFQYLSPAVLGVLCGGAATAAAREPLGRIGTRVRALAAVLAVLGVALGFVLEGTYGVLDGSTDVLVPYAIAAAASWLWTAPPKRAKPAAEG